MVNIIPEEQRFADPDDIKSQIREYVKLKASEDMIKKRTAEIRDVIFAQIEEEGYEDDKGNQQLDLEEAIDGVFRLEKQRRTKRILNEEAAEEILAELEIAEEVYEMKPVLNEDALMAAFYEGKITDEQLDSIYPLTVTWALRTIKK
jgi:hypothetical protein